MTFYPTSQQFSLLGIKNAHFQVSSTSCTEHDVKAGTDLTSSIKSAGFLSLKELPKELKELPKGAKGHHPPSVPARFSLWQTKLWTKPQSVNEHKHLPLRETKSRTGDSGEAGDQLNEQFLGFPEIEVSPLPSLPVLQEAPEQNSLVQNSNWECLPHVQSSTTRAGRKNWS